MSDVLRVLQARRVHGGFGWRSTPGGGSGRSPNVLEYPHYRLCRSGLRFHSLFECSQLSSTQSHSSGFQLSVRLPWLMSRFVMHHFGHPTIVIIHSRNTSTAFRPNTRDWCGPNPICDASPQPLLILERPPTYVPNSSPATEYLSTVPSLKHRHAGVLIRVPAF